MGFIDLLVIALSFTITTSAAVIYTLKLLRRRGSSAPPAREGGDGVKTKVLVREAVPRGVEENPSISAQLIATRREIEEIRLGISSVIKEVEELD